MRGRVSPRASLKVVFTSCSGCFQSSEGSAANFADAPALPSPGTFALPRAHGNAKIYLEYFLCPFGFIVVEGGPRPMTNGR